MCGNMTSNTDIILPYKSKIVYLELTDENVKNYIYCPYIPKSLQEDDTEEST